MTLLVRPNPASGVPVYAQLVEQVRRGLETGALRPGDPLPDVHPLAEALVVHPNAVARAYRELEGQLIVSRSSGVLRAAVLPVAAKRERLSTLEAENRRLTARVAADATDRARQAHELATAREVQRRLLPQSFAAIDGVDYAGCSRAAGAVGGDYYDFVMRPDDRLAVALGDVCGKGVPAALLMASLRAYLHSELARPDAQPGQVVTTLNRRLCDSAPSNRFATFFYAEYDIATRALEYVNAGHHAPIVIRVGSVGREILRLGASGLALGWMPGATYASARVTLEPGDLLVVFSDGVTEAMNAAGEEWAEAGLLSALASLAPGATAAAVVDRVFAEIGTFKAGAPSDGNPAVAARAPDASLAEASNESDDSLAEASSEPDDSLAEASSESDDSLAEAWAEADDMTLVALRVM